MARLEVPYACSTVRLLELPGSRNVTFPLPPGVHHGRPFVVAVRAALDMAARHLATEG